MSGNPSITFEDWEAKKTQDPAVRAAVEELGPTYRATRLRVLAREVCALSEGEPSDVHPTRNARH